jgi:ubiquinone/menaquinone biosynthesis C-methylase UbiE
MITAAEYWSDYHVDAPDSGFSSVVESFEHLDWRNRIYPGYIESMPVNCATGSVVLDYGCGPGNDIVGFGHFSKPARLIGADISQTALRLAAQRARLHGISAEFLHLKEHPISIALPDGSVDLVHSSGVLMMVPDPIAVLCEFRRVLRPDGHAQIMVYHRDSIWLHLYVGYVKLLLEGAYKGLTKLEAFQRSTDGEDCPISRCYTFEEFSALAKSAGFICTEVGVSMSTTELKVLAKRWDALEDKHLDVESREFLYNLMMTDRGWPVYNGRVAGINLACRLHPV